MVPVVLMCSGLVVGAWSEPVVRRKRNTDLGRSRAVGGPAGVCTVERTALRRELGSDFRSSFEKNRFVALSLPYASSPPTHRSALTRAIGHILNAPL